MKIDNARLSRIWSGEHPAKSQEVAMMAQILRTTGDEVLRRLGEVAPPGSTMRLAGEVDAAGRVLLFDRTADRPTVPAPGQLPPGSQALRCTAPGHPLYGWVLYWTDEAGVSPRAVDRLCIVTTDAGETLVRILRRGLDNDHWSLQAVDGGAVEQATVRSASPVLLIRP